MRATLIVSAVLLLVVSGCGSKAEKTLKEQVSVMNDLADAIESDADEATLNQLKERMEASAQTLKDVKVTKAEEERLKKKYKKSIDDAGARIMTATMGKIKKSLPAGTKMPGAGQLPNF